MKGNETKKDIHTDQQNDINKISEVKVYKEVGSVNKKTIKQKKSIGGVYIGYAARVTLSLIFFVLFFALSLLFFSKAVNLKENEVINYNENGYLDYKVYLKPNQFYETDYLEKGMSYVASLIKNVSVDINYQFIIAQQADMNFSYEVVGVLAIYGDSNQGKLYEKEYLLKEEKLSDSTSIQQIKDSFTIDYDYYNELANSFKTTYGVDATSDLTVYVRVKKDVKNDEKNININQTSDMSLKIPLTQKTLNIQMDQTGISNSNSIVNESKFSLSNVVSGILSFVLFVAMVACLLKLLELLFLLSPKQSKYDKYIKKLLTEYDRLIVETPTTPDFSNKNIIKIERIEEIIDARDNLKRPVMYHNLINHHKSYFYIESENTVYLYVVKATDIDDKKEKNNKK